MKKSNIFEYTGHRPIHAFSNIDDASTLSNFIGFVIIVGPWVDFAILILSISSISNQKVVITILIKHYFFVSPVEKENQWTFWKG